MLSSATQGHCPACGHVTDAATSPFRDVAPKDGDYSICVYCHEPAVFVVTAFGASARAMSPAERAEAVADPEYLVAVAALRSSGFGGAS